MLTNPLPPPPPPLPIPLVEPLPELTVFSEFWLPCGVRFSSVKEAGWLLLWWEDAGEAGTSFSVLGTRKVKKRRLVCYELTKWSIKEEILN